MKSYASVADLKARLGITDSNHDDELALALVSATRYIDLRTDTDAVADDDWTGNAADVVVESAPKASYVAATLAMAVRIHKSPDVPFGVAGMSDQGMVAYVRQTMPEVELILFGETLTPGVA